VVGVNVITRPEAEDEIGTDANEFEPLSEPRRGGIAGPDNPPPTPGPAAVEEDDDVAFVELTLATGPVVVVALEPNAVNREGVGGTLALDAAVRRMDCWPKLNGKRGKAMVPIPPAPTMEDDDGTPP
jgi:hypothetical protein